MFGKLTRIAALATALMAVVGVAQASASTWRVTGSTSFTASGNPGSLSTSRGTLSCTGGTATGRFSANSSTSQTWNNAATGTVTFSGCRIGGTSYATSCSRYQLNAGPNYDFTPPGRASGTITAAVCSVTLAGREICAITQNLNALSATYTNPATQLLDIGSNTTALDVRDGSGGSCPLTPPGVTLTGALTNLRFTVTSSPAPVLTVSP